MAEYVTLLGAEDVRRAGHQMASAAEDINRALLSLDQTLSLYVERVERALDEHAARIEAAMRPAESGEEESDAAPGTCDECGHVGTEAQPTYYDATEDETLCIACLGVRSDDEMQRAIDGRMGDS